MAQSRCEVMSRWIIAALCLASAQSAPPTIGPWPTNFTTYEVAVLDRTNPRVWLIYPICDLSECPKFPLISYMHGLAGGDIALNTGYIRHLRELSSYGFVVAAPYSCVFGCNDTSHGAPWTDCAGILPVKPIGWPAYYGEGLKAIDWARNMSRGGSSDKVFTTIDWDAGVGISGHSMGGQAATIAASAACAKRWDIRAAVLEHPANGDIGGGHNIGSNISVPVAAFTGSADPIWPETQAIMQALNSTKPQLPQAYRYLVGASHLEPVLLPPIENPLLATFSAAWFKVFLNKDTGFYHDLVFGEGPDSLCKYAKMVDCYANPG